MKQIRIIEDDTAIRTELKTLLQTNGYLPVEDGPCDLILMDVNLPGENGYTLCRKLRQTSSTPVIFLTARDTPEDELLARIGRILKTTVNGSPTVRGLTLDLPGITPIIPNLV